MSYNEILRLMPRVDILAEEVLKTAEDLSYNAVLEASRKTIEGYRNRIINGEIISLPALAKITHEARKLAEKSSEYSLKRVINATGVVIHTNLGRSPLSKKVLEHIIEIASGYSTLEYNLETGARGSRHSHAEMLICALTGAEAAMAVNNNAAAVMLALSSIASGKDVVVSRGELVEIGGSFRIPDIMELSGAHLVAVGTTNKTKPGDYDGAITQSTAALLKVHTSNFKIVGFSESVDIPNLKEIALNHNIPVIYDLGSGLVDGNYLAGLSNEATVLSSIRHGADIVCFSADKLFGGPQAGILAGKKCYIDAMKKHQLARVVRIDKLTLAGLEATLRLYLEGKKEEIPVLKYIGITPKDLKNKAKKLSKMLSGRGIKTALIESIGQIGGGSAPGEDLPSFVLEISHKTKSAVTIEKELREYSTPIVTRINKGNVLVDVRTVEEKDFVLIANALKSILEA